MIKLKYKLISASVSMDLRSEVLKMASSSDSQERYKLYKFTKILTLKVAQIVVQSRQGKKITHDYSTSKPPEELPSSPSNLQWVCFYFYNFCNNNLGRVRSLFFISRKVWYSLVRNLLRISLRG